MEGAAYRGRVLLQLETTVGQYPKEPIADLSQNDLVQVVVRTLALVQYYNVIS